MARGFRLCVFAVLAAALGCAGPAAAQTKPKPKPKQEEGVPVPPMRPAQQPEAPVAAVPPPVILASPIPRNDFPDSAPRIGGLAEQARGGSLCRSDCARSYYRCLSDDDMSSCGPAWSQCQVGCPPVSSSE